VQPSVVMRQQHQRACPQCQALVPVHTGYITWCDRCGWNLKPEEGRRPRNRLASLHASLGRTQSRMLFDRFVRAQSLQPGLSAARVLAYVIAGAVHLMTLALVPLGIIFVVRGRPNFLFVGLGLLCLATAWVLRPRPQKLPTGIARRDSFPALYTLVDAVAQSLGTSRVRGIVVDEQFNAAFAQVGWRRHKVLYLGLPLWSILDGQEKVALLAHELAHGVNRDAHRGFFVGTAIHSLATWYALLHPDRIVNTEDGLLGLLAIPLNLVLLGLSNVARLGVYALSYLLWRDSQRAEYLADALAATVSGTEAMLSMLEKLHFERTFALALQRVSVSRDNTRDLFDDLRLAMAAVPARELERVRRVQQLETSRLDVTHPPTLYRVALLQAHPVERPTVRLATGDCERIDREVMSVRDQIQRELLDLYEAHLYGY
jgi:Zn-dependent protease with chaperone function